MHIENMKGLERAFVETILTFLEIYNREPIEPPSVIQPILSTYHRGIELYVMAHEYAHVAHGHVDGGPILVLSNGDEVVLGMEDPFQSADNDDCIDRQPPLHVLQMTPEERARSWVNELEADITAARILEQVWEEAGNDSTFRHALIKTPEFFFAAMEVVEDARAILSGADGFPGPVEVEQRMLEVVSDCLGSSGCNVRQVLTENEGELIGVGDHPHPETRRRLVHALLSQRTASEENSMTALASLLSLNLQRIWERVRPRFFDLYRWGVRVDP